MTNHDKSQRRAHWRSLALVAGAIAVGAAGLAWSAAQESREISAPDELTATTTVLPERLSAAHATLALAESVKQVEDAVAKDQAYRAHLAELVAAAPHDPNLQLVSQRLDDLCRHTRALWRSTMNYAVATCAAGFVPRAACDAYIARLSQDALNQLP